MTIWGWKPQGNGQNAFKRLLQNEVTIPKFRQDMIKSEIDYNLKISKRRFFKQFLN